MSSRGVARGGGDQRSASVPRRNSSRTTGWTYEVRQTAGRVAELTAHDVQHVVDVGCGAAFGSRGRQRCERGRREQRRDPRPVVLGRHVGVGRLPEVRVDVVRADRVTTVFVDVLEQDLARYIAALAHGAHETRVVYGHGVDATALSREHEVEMAPVRPHVAIAQRRQPERAVVTRVLLVADSHERRLEEPNDHRDDELTRHLALAQITPYPASDLRERVGEIEETLELRGIALRPPFRVVSILLAPTRVAPGCLQVRVRFPGDPDVGPRRRDRERADPRELRVAAHRPAVGIRVREAAARAASTDPGLLVRHVLEQPRRSAHPTTRSRDSGGRRLISCAPIASASSATSDRVTSPRASMRNDAAHASCNALGVSTSSITACTAAARCGCRRLGTGVQVASPADELGDRVVAAGRDDGVHVSVPLPVRARPWSSSSGRARSCASPRCRAAPWCGRRVPGAIGARPAGPTRCHRWTCGSPSSLRRRAPAPCSPSAPRSPRRCLPARPDRADLP